MHILHGLLATIASGYNWLRLQKPEDTFVAVAAFALAALAGSLLMERDPAGVIRRSLEKRGVGFILGSLAVGFAAEMLLEIMRAG